jgi:hypothetical protein
MVQLKTERQYHQANPLCKYQSRERITTALCTERTQKQML